MVERVIQLGDSSAATKPVALDSSSAEGRTLRKRSGNEVSSRDKFHSPGGAVLAAREQEELTRFNLSNTRVPLSSANNVRS